MNHDKKLRKDALITMAGNVGIIAFLCACGYKSVWRKIEDTTGKELTREVNLLTCVLSCLSSVCFNAGMYLYHDRIINSKNRAIKEIQNRHCDEIQEKLTQLEQLMVVPKAEDTADTTQK